MEHKIALSGTLTQCRQQLNDYVHTSGIPTEEQSAVRATADYVATRVLDPGDAAFRKAYDDAVAARQAPPTEPTQSITITVSVVVA